VCVCVCVISPAHDQCEIQIHLVIGRSMHSVRGFLTFFGFSFFVVWRREGETKIFEGLFFFFLWFVIILFISQIFCCIYIQRERF
jgi:hypothetical protein